MNHRILIVVTEFPPAPGGIGTHAWSLGRSLSGKGIDVTVVTDQYINVDTTASFDRQQSFDIHRIERKFPWFFYNRFAVVIDLLKRKSIHQIIVSGRFGLWIGFVIKVLYGKRKRVLAVLHGSEVNPSNRFFKVLNHTSIKTFDQLVYVSEFTRKLLPDKIAGNIPFRILPNGVDNDELLQYDLKTDQSLSGDPSLITVGNVSRRKGQHRVIRHLPHLRQLYPQIHYHVFGVPTMAQAFKKLAYDLGVQDCVTFHGKISQRSQLMENLKRATVFVMLSENQPDGDVEGYGIAILEANALGVPAIGARGCGIEDAIKNKYNGILINGDNEKEFTLALKEILAEKEPYSIRAKQWASAHDWSVLADRYIEFMFPAL